VLDEVIPWVMDAVEAATIGRGLALLPSTTFASSLVYMPNAWSPSRIRTYALRPPGRSVVRTGRDVVFYDDNAAHPELVRLDS
jgi:hypothetical protein